MNRILSFLWQFEIVSNSPEGVETVWEGYWKSSELFHGSIADAEQRKNEIKFLDRDDLLAVLMIKERSNDNQDGQKKLGNIVKGGISIKNKMIVTLFKEEVVIFFNQ